MIEALRNGTRSEHKELDMLLIPVIKRMRTIGDCADLLAIFYGFMHPMQGRIDLYLNDGLVTDYALRRRPERLLNDIQALGGYTGSLTRCELLPVIGNTDEALGAYYVLEGSTLGGPVIARLIGENLQIGDGKGLSFFAGYGDNNREMWESFVKSMEETTAGSPDTAIVESARRTFECLKNWIIEGYARKENKKAP